MIIRRSDLKDDLRSSRSRSDLNDCLRQSHSDLKDDRRSSISKVDYYQNSS